MKAGLALLYAGLGLAGCSAWQGGSTAVAPIAVASLQLEPSVPSGTAAVAAAPPEGSTGAWGAAGTAPVARVSGGSFPVVPSAVAEAALQPSVPNGQSNVAPVAAAGSVALVPVAAGGLAEPRPVAPARGASSRPAAASDASNPVGFALATSHPVGQKVYPRRGAAPAAACGGYGSGVSAQQAFLKAGGPQSDGLGLDPDGDGYACSFDPEPYRRAARG
ncbi:hypothetical protein [Mangrovicoccus sp. HB161399]|uniref:hypothetical protein n=1 Tax=Mangrovicoccus sp. HB161399 TaxID=2720392 RepID=UPI00155417FE|nr:hypothetical protein [Mangrovicoccus sp. HB161399]